MGGDNEFAEFQFMKSADSAETGAKSKSEKKSKKEKKDKKEKKEKKSKKQDDAAAVEDTAFAAADEDAALKMFNSKDDANDVSPMPSGDPAEKAEAAAAEEAAAAKEDENKIPDSLDDKQAVGADGLGVFKMDSEDDLEKMAEAEVNKKDYDFENLDGADEESIFSHKPPSSSDAHLRMIKLKYGEAGRLKVAELLYMLEEAAEVIKNAGVLDMEGRRAELLEERAALDLKLFELRRHADLDSHFDAGDFEDEMKKIKKFRMAIARLDTQEGKNTSSSSDSAPSDGEDDRLMSLKVARKTMQYAFGEAERTQKLTRGTQATALEMKKDGAGKKAFNRTKSIAEDGGKGIFGDDTSHNAVDAKPENEL